MAFFLGTWKSRESQKQFLPQLIFTSKDGTHLMTSNFKKFPSYKESFVFVFYLNFQTMQLFESFIHFMS